MFVYELNGCRFESSCSHLYLSQIVTKLLDLSLESNVPYANQRSLNVKMADFMVHGDIALVFPLLVMVVDRWGFGLGHF